MGERERQGENEWEWVKMFCVCVCVCARACEAGEKQKKDFSMKKAYVRILILVSKKVREFFVSSSCQPCLSPNSILGEFFAATRVRERDANNSIVRFVSSLAFCQPGTFQSRGQARTNGSG